MGRLRQYNANRYRSSDAVNSEFENVIEYINSAELGNLTLRELLSKVFSEDGDVELGVRFRYDTATGLSVAIGNDSEDWTVVLEPEDIRGAPGVSVGTIDGPVYFNRVDYVATLDQTEFSYTTSGAADVLVFADGLLQEASAYAYSSSTNTVTMATPQALDTKVTVYSVRNNASSTYRRTDYTATASQTVFPFAHDADESIQVYSGGALQREGALYDYILSSGPGTITMTAPQADGTKVSAIAVQNGAVRDVLGIMLEDRYATDGLIRYDRIAVADEQIPSAKVAGLVADLSLRGDTYVGPTPPTSPRPGALWINTSTPSPTLLFFDGVRWSSASPGGSLPSPTASDALKFLRLNSAANSYELAALDLSGVVETSLIGAPGGVAGLSVSGKLPAAQMTQIHRIPTIGGLVSGSISNGTRNAGLLLGNRFSLTSAAVQLGAGTATVTIRVGGVDIGGPLPASVWIWRPAFSPIIVDAIANALPVQMVVTGATSASDLTWCLYGERVE